MTNPRHPPTTAHPNKSGRRVKSLDSCYILVSTLFSRIHNTRSSSRTTAYVWHTRITSCNVILQTWYIWHRVIINWPDVVTSLAHQSTSLTLWVLSVGTFSASVICTVIHFALFLSLKTGQPYSKSIVTYLWSWLIIMGMILDDWICWSPPLQSLVITITCNNSE
jgi:hypothetical protein